MGSPEEDASARKAGGLLRLASERSGRNTADALSGAGGALIEGAPDGIAVLDADGVVVAWNSAAARMFMIDRSQAGGRELATLIFPAHLRSAVRGVMQRQLTEPDAPVAQRQLELAAVRGDGREIPVDVTTAVIGNGHSTLLAVYLRDVSERGERERELHIDARRRSAVLDLGQLALEGMDLDRLLQQAVDLTTEELGVDRCEVWQRIEGEAELELRTSSGWPESKVMRIPLTTTSQPGFTILRGQGAVVVEDFRREGRFAPVEPADMTPIQSSISMRIPGDDSGFGALVVCSHSPRRFQLSDISLIESLAQLLGAAIERVNVNDSLAQAERRVRTLIERLPSITYRAGLGKEGEWTFVSPQVFEILGFTVEEWISDPLFWEEHLHPADVDWVIEEEHRCARESRPLDVEYRIRKSDGQMIWVRDRASLGEPDENGVMIVEGLITDISEQKAAEERLRYLADHDELTGLLNRRGFEEAADAAIEGVGLPAGRGALVLVDLDHLKRVNDTLGRATGDRVIAEIARMLEEELGGDFVFGRVDNDEFGLLIPGVGEAQALERANSLIAIIRTRQGGATLTASAGVALVERGMGIGTADLLTAADVALHQAKEAGRDRTVVFTGEDRGRLEWVGHVRKAIEDHRLVLFSQPIVDMATGSLVAEELLVRMIDPNTGKPVSAGDFVPTAERFGLIKNLDHWVVARALEMAAGGRRVSANISAASIGDRDLTSRIASSLEHSGADPRLLTFEITETAATPAVDSLRDFTSRVQEIGCGLSLDDVGTGFGSLTYLRHLPFTELKIDMQFVRGLLDSNADARIVESLVVIAKGLGMRTVAEGIETPNMIEPLRELGVDYGQGYLFGRPAQVAALGLVPAVTQPGSPDRLSLDGNPS
ncbi:MAG: EAL domain-containing protein [Actinomycetota bacterium]|nr:EAL domain-containing protein [Actinomycetota bacterium]